MIDFRYHLVSIVAVFLALALGIIIGATSLRGQVGDALNSQVSELRSNRQDLRQQLDLANAASKRQDQYAEDVAAKALPGQLTDRTVAVVALPGTSNSLVAATTSGLELAGAKVVSSTRLDDSWLSGQDADRQQLLTSSAKMLGLDTSSIPDNRLAGRVLLESLARGSAPTGPDVTATSVVTRLHDAGLVDTSTKNPDQATSVVVLWPAMSGKSDDQKSAVRGWADIITAMGLGGQPAVAAASGANGGDLSTPDALITLLRQGPEVTAAMSTVDDAGKSVGVAAVVLALRDEYRDQAGSYGLDKDATSIAPSIKAP